MKKFVIPDDINEERLDIALSRIFEVSRSRIQRLIKNKEITLGGQPIKASQMASSGEVLEIPDTFEQEPVQKGPLPKLRKIFEDSEVLVIEKPAGLLVHRANEADKEATLVDALLDSYPDIAEVGDDMSRPGIVHRLDKNVSGVMIAAKTQSAFEHLKRQFASRQVEKEYVALVYGQLSKEHDTIDLKIVRSKTKGHMIARPKDAEGKEAVTHYDVMERFKTATLVKVTIETGRTHQIRVHFLSIDHPVVGDPLYKKKQMKNIRPIEMNRIFLHATKLSLTLPDGEKLTFESPLPEDLKKILTTLPKQ